MSSQIYIIAGARTPIGSFQGELSTVSSTRLGAKAIEAAIDRSSLEKEQIQATYMGQVVTAGVGQAPARQAALFAGLSQQTPCTTVGKVCGSGMEAIILGHQSLSLARYEYVVAGGMESMSLAPHLVTARVPAKFGDVPLRDSLVVDGLMDVYSQKTMGVAAEACAKKFQFSREQQDQFAKESFMRAQRAQSEGLFNREIIAVETSEKNPRIIEKDEGPFKADFNKMVKLKPAFMENGTITAANASTLNDGAAAVVMTANKKSTSKEVFLIRSYAGHAQEPLWFTTAPIAAMEKCAHFGKVSLKDVDLFEINEAFANVPMGAIHQLEIDHQKVNINGGAIALGHPLGCSGARIIVTLMHALIQQNKTLGMASLCIGGGEALAMLIERVQ